MNNTYSTYVLFICKVLTESIVAWRVISKQIQLRLFWIPEDTVPLSVFRADEQANRLTRWRIKMPGKAAK
jgi:hypothetical protein